MKNKVISLSGGLDSTILLYKLVNDFGNDKIIALTFQYGQRHSIEIEKAKTTCNKLGVQHKIIDISFLGDLVSPVCSLIKNSDLSVPDIKSILGNPAPNTEVPFRNLLFCALSLSCAQSNDADEVYLSLNKIDKYSYWDTSNEFVERINAICELNRIKLIQFVTPFVNIGKTEEIKIGIELNVDFNDTITCYNPDSEGKSCGECGSCSERINAFIQNKQIDPIEYQIDIPWNKYI